MCTYTTGLPGCTYFGKITLSSIKSDNFPTTFMVGVYFSSPMMFETFILYELIIVRNIFNSLEKGYFNTQILQFSQKFNLFWGVLARVDQPPNKRRWIELRNTLFILSSSLFRGKRWVVIWNHSPRPKVDLLDFHSISMIG